MFIKHCRHTFLLLHICLCLSFGHILDGHRRSFLPTLFLSIPLDYYLAQSITTLGRRTASAEAEQIRTIYLPHHNPASSRGFEMGQTETYRSIQTSILNGLLSEVLSENFKYIGLIVMYCISGECVPDSTNESLHFCEILAWYGMVIYNYESASTRIRPYYGPSPIIAKTFAKLCLHLYNVHDRCPVENDEKLSPTPVLNNTQKFTVYIKNSVAFPYFGMEYRKNNILGKYF